MATPRHNISLRINDKIIDRWQRYSITNDMLTPADGFELELSPGLKEAWELVPPDSVVEVRIDGTPVLTGYIDDRELAFDKGQGTTLRVSGRDKSSRMIDESATLRTLGKLNIRTLAEILIESTFSEVLLDNRANRDLVRGRRSGKAPAGNEPLFSKSSEAPKKIEPGQTRWEVLQFFLEPARLLAWSSADGKSLIIGLPNYAQRPQFRFFLPDSGSQRVTEGNIKSITFSDSTANRYSIITVYGSSKGDDDNDGKHVIRHRTTTRFGPNADGTGDAEDPNLANFTARKQLILHDEDVHNTRDSRERAAREMALRNAEGLTVQLTVAGHSQAIVPGAVPAVYAFDTLAELELEPIGFKGQFLITSVVFDVDKQGGEQSTITLVPKGTELVS